MPTVSSAPLPRASRSTASTTSAAATSGSWRSGISTAPAWPPAPESSTRRVAGAAIAVTTPIGTPSRSRSGPCSMWSSTKAA